MVVVLTWEMPDAVTLLEEVLRQAPAGICTICTDCTDCVVCNAARAQDLEFSYHAKARVDRGRVDGQAAIIP